MFTPNLFNGTIVAVSGGGSGIGLTIARQFLQYGATVFIASRKEERLQKALEILSPLGTCHAFALDIRNPDEVERFAEYIKDKCGRLDILVNNAGGQFPSAAELISPNGWNAVINTNLNGTFFMTRQMFTSFFMEQKQGVVVNIIANIYKGFPGMAHTGAARAGVDNLTKTLAVEWSPYKVRVNAVAPGIIKSSGLEQYPPEILQGISDKIPLKRLGSTDEVAYLTLFLASPMASFITGETVYIDGGQRLWGDMWEM
ncbi:KR domain-containing protein [Sphingobacteriales bacterium UPWRP_1]|nr:trans-2-enoyl-CoA reductase [Sphingobacteriales bacterium TSM_CSM]PSJ72650.1 KR domain-containing protein [Sphingobacteriales bacterium UPWRP_1]